VAINPNQPESGDDNMHTQPPSIFSSADPVQRTFPLGITQTDFYAMAIRKL
jgi:hypothetical protein